MDQNSLRPRPIDPLLPDIVAALHERGRAIITAPTGSGKTTRVPPALLAAGLADAGRIVMIEPRRIAARAAARFMAREQGEKLGETYGYQVRFENKSGPKTRVLVVTPGIFLRYLQDDPLLESTALVIFDEFHERGLDADLALGMARLIRRELRPELRFALMSATLDTAKLAAVLDDPPVLSGQGRSYPVETRFLGGSLRRQDQAEDAARAIEKALADSPGDVLAFFDGMGAIRRCERALDGRLPGVEVHVLHGDMDPRAQDQAIEQGPRRKAVLSTNVAETSLTIEGVTAVVDSGLARVQVYDAGAGLNRLDTRPISRASADQRAGRAGRTASGLCLRLWTASEHRTRPADIEPELARVDLSSAVLQLIAFGEQDPAAFPWPEPPPRSKLDAALADLRRLGALDDRGLTRLGRELAALPVHPRLGRLLIAGRDHGAPQSVALIAALLSERDPFIWREEDRRAKTDSDVLDALDALEGFSKSGQKHSALGLIKSQTARFILKAQRQLARPIEARGDTANEDDEAVMRALLAAFPDRLVRRREKGSRRGLMVGGRGVVLDSRSGVLEPELFLAVAIEGGGPEARVRLASRVDRSWIPEQSLKWETAVFFDEKDEKLYARRRLVYGEDLVLEEAPASLDDDPQAAAEALATAARERLERVIPGPDSDFARDRARLLCLAEWAPELELPVWDEAALIAALPSLCPGRRSFAELRKAPWLATLKGGLTYHQQQSLDRMAPLTMAAATGSKIRLRYEPGRPPVMAVRIQEMYGLTESPTVAAGRVKVLLHLLAPNQRPQQITDDLPGFWERTYPQVRKDLRGRYPKHSWPEDPARAAPERRPRRKKK